MILKCLLSEQTWKKHSWSLLNPNLRKELLISKNNAAIET